MRVDVCEVAESKLGDAVTEAWTLADNSLLEARANYWMNLSFYQGYQWVWWNRERRTIDEVPRESDDQVHAKVNLIRPRVDSLKGRLTNRPLHFEAKPTGVDDATLRAATITEQVIEARRVDDGWEELRSDTVFSMLMGATQLVLPYWDPRVDDVKLDSFNIAEFTLEQGTRRPRDARYMILARAMPPHQIRDLYDLPETPPSESSQESSPVQRRIALQRATHADVDLAVVYQYFQRPIRNRKGKIVKKGRVVTIVDKKVVECEDWPFPFEHLPGYVFRATIIPQRWFGDTPLNDARSIQAMYNAIRSTTTENAKKASNSRLTVPIGSVPDEDELTDEPGQIIHYIADQSGGGPRWLEAPSLPRDLRYEADRLTTEMDSILYTHATSRGEAPGDRNSGLALSILAEKDDTPLGAIARDQQTGWAAIASQTVQMYEQNVTKERTSRVADRDSVPVSVQWTGEMLSGQSDIVIPPESVMPYSRAATQAMLVELKQSFPEQFTNMDTPTFLRLLDLRGADHLREVMDDDVACAIYENVMMAQGEIELPEEWHDHAVHIVEHNRERNSTRFRLADEDVREVYADHIKAHEQMIRDEFEQTREANDVLPGLGALPTANETLGSMMPRDHIDGAAPVVPAMPAGMSPPV